MNPLFQYHLNQTRRQFFASAGLSLGGLALSMCNAALKPATTGRLRCSARLCQGESACIRILA